MAWLDCLARGAKLGRALLTRGAFMAHDELPSPWASDPLRLPPGGQLRVPVDAPSVLLNRVSVGLFNALYYRRGRARTGTRPGHFAPFFFPLDRLAAWNRLYGRKGFVQYQCVLPKAESASGLAALLTRLTAVRAGIIPRGAQTVRTGRGRADVVSHAGLYAGARSSVPPGYAGAARRTGCYYPSTRRGASTLPRMPVARRSGCARAIPVGLPLRWSGPRLPGSSRDSFPRFHAAWRCDFLPAARAVLR